MFKSFLTLLAKDLRLELRCFEVLALLLVLVLLLATISAFGVGSAFINQATTIQLYPLLLWMSFVLSATVALARSYDAEYEEAALEGLLLSRVSPAMIYLSKMVSNTLIMFLAQLLNVILLAVLLRVPIWDVIGGLLLIVFLVVSAYSALSSLLAGIAVQARLKGLLLPLILLPLIFPLFFAALELSSALLTTGTFAWPSFWFKLLLLLDLLYLLLGLNLFEYVVKE